MMLHQQQPAPQHQPQQQQQQQAPQQQAQQQTQNQTQQQQQQLLLQGGLRPYFKTPEGVYRLSHEKVPSPGTLQYSSQRLPTKVLSSFFLP